MVICHLQYYTQFESYVKTMSNKKAEIRVGTCSEYSSAAHNIDKI